MSRPLDSERKVSRRRPPNCDSEPKSNLNRVGICHVLLVFGNLAKTVERARRNLPQLFGGNGLRRHPANPLTLMPARGLAAERKSLPLYNRAFRWLIGSE